MTKTHKTLPSEPRKASGKLEGSLLFLLELIDQDPDITLAELQAPLRAAHNLKYLISGIDVLLRHRGYTYKKGMTADERHKPAIRKTRHECNRRQNATREQPHRLIFLDKTGHQYQNDPRIRAEPARLAPQGK